MKIGFLVNPIAGMGGLVGLKGTDGVVDEAVERGAKPVVPARAGEALDEVERDGFIFLCCAGPMGADLLEGCGFDYEIVYEPTSRKTTGVDTVNTCRVFLKNDVDLVFFCGGDGTARDIYSVVGDKMPLLGIPAGVKMYSGVFAVNPRVSADLFNRFIKGELDLTDAEVMDIDEEKYRSNVLDSQLYGIARVPYEKALIQHPKSIFTSESDDACKRRIALFAFEFMHDDSLYIVGAGSTTKAVFDALGLEKTLLGVDAVKNRAVVARDLSEKEILALLDINPKTRIIVSPIGAQGFVFGRGNQQISSRIIRRVGVNNIIILATPSKLAGTENLLVDTGDRKLDEELSGYHNIICNYRMGQRKNILSF
ncbi:MAG: ATP-NAD kinase family protein [Candidatus Altiarchaeota archaeon]|nr:ATP-NAD kinase family protein [Candidatus Altiarchaeota archaeon]